MGECSVPQLLRIGPYVVYFWSNESEPLEPVHVHIAKGKPVRDATKLWITSTGRVLLCNNHSKIPERLLNRLSRLIEANSEDFVRTWKEHFGEVRYYC